MLKDISRIKDHFKENRLFFNRAMLAMISIGILFLVLIASIFYLQIIQNDLYVTLAKNNQLRIVPIPPSRGLIYDRNGVLLVENSPSFSLTIIPGRTRNLTKAIEELKDVLPVSEQEITNFYKQIKYKGRYDQIPIKQKLTEEELAKFAVEKYRFPDIEISATLSRNYIYKDILAHSIGYIGPISDSDLESLDLTKYRGINQIGKIGLEKYYEDVLRGEIGFRQVETNSRGRFLRTLEEKEALPGKNLYLGIDIRLQQKASEAFLGRRGAFIAMDPKSGDILAFVSSPGFDPNIFTQGISNSDYKILNEDKNKPLFNRATRGQYSPGSTVKPIIALKALEDGVITKQFHLFDPGYYQINGVGRKFRDWQRLGHGRISVIEAITESSSIFFYYVAHNLGISRLHNLFSSFNLGKRTNIDIDNEAEGIVPSAAWKQRVKKQPWYLGETLIVGIGQGYTLATPVQIMTMAATIANRGTLIQPKLVRFIENPSIPNSEEIVQHKTLQIPLKHIENWDVIIGGMERVTSHPRGTAYKYFFNFSVPVAGKTGTTQVFGLKQDEKYVKSKIDIRLRDHSWFMAFAPIDNPVIAVAVILENESGAPQIARDVIEYYLSKEFTKELNGE